MNIMGTILRKIYRNNNKLNILTCPTHESNESILANCFPQHTWYSLYHPSVKTWNSKFRPCPNNYIFLENGKIPEELDFDIVISQNRFGQYQLLAPIAQQYNIPLLCVEHTLNYPTWPKSMLNRLQKMKGDIDIFITDMSRRSWGWNENNSIVVEHAIDSNLFKPDELIQRKPYILSVCNQFTKPVRFEPCGHPLWQQVIQPNTPGMLPFRHIGDQDEPLGHPASSVSELVSEYQQARIFINTSQLSPIPMSLLEAASSGCAIISTNNCAISDYFTHGENALLSNDPNELRMYCNELLRNENFCKYLGQNARKMIQTKCDLSSFIKKWEQVFERACAL